MFNHHWSIENVTFYILYIIEHFKIERCMFASNFPVDKLYCDFSTLMNRYHMVIDTASVAEKEKIFFSNAQRIYQIII
jgi:predicted TIM-barrel fold metal-dependent hydrolase